MSSARAKREVTSPKGVALKRPGPPGGVRDTNRLKKSQAIRDAALLLFLERGIEGVSVDDIMKAAKMAKGSFYRYFADQTALVDDLMAQRRDAALRVLQTSGGPIDRAFEDRLSARAEAHQRLGRLVDALGAQGDVSLAALTVALRQVRGLVG